MKKNDSTQNLNKRPNYIKIDNLKKLFITLELDFPKFLEMRKLIDISQLKPAELELSKNDSYWEPLKAITLISDLSYNSLWEILSINQRFKLPEKIISLYVKCIEGFNNKEFKV